jgi:hypothetical protein
MVQLHQLGLLLLTSAADASKSTRRRLQPAAAACCYAGGAVEYTRSPACDPLARYVSHWLDMKACWERLQQHYGNTTTAGPSDCGIDGDKPCTIAELYPIFIINLASGIDIAAPPGPFDVLALDASALPPGLLPSQGPMGSFDIVISFPTGPDQTPGSCPTASLRGLTLVITDKHHVGAHPLNVQIAGCGRVSSLLPDFQLVAVGWGMPSFEFIGMANASITAVAPTSTEGQGATAAVSWIEADILDSSVSYFGDIEGDFGNSYGATQNGSRAVRCNFDVVNPKELYGPTYKFRPTDADSNYQFAWCKCTASFYVSPFEAHTAYSIFLADGATWGAAFSHIEDCMVEYISDVELGSVNVSGSSITPWLAAESPLFSGRLWNGYTNAPGITAYNMGSDSAPNVDMGCRIINSQLVGIWSIGAQYQASLNR